MPSSLQVTTVIPTFQRPYLLRRAIRSVLDQTYPYLQVCVYDNASSDETAEVVSALASEDSRVRYYRHPENIGPQENFIFGVSRVETPLFNLLSDDDFLLPDFLAEATAALQENPAAGFFFGTILSADPKGDVKACWNFGSEAGKTCSPPSLFHLLAPNTRTWTSILFRRSLSVCLGGLKRETGHGADTDFILRAAAQYPAILSNTPCAIFTMHPESISVARFPDTFESSLNLDLLTSVNEAIDKALGRHIVTEQDANAMKARLRRVTEQNLIRGAFGVIARGRLPLAARASEILTEVFDRKHLAGIIKAAARNNSIGSSLRLLIRCVRSLRQVRAIQGRPGRHTAESGLVKDRLLHLTS
jgi:hypothetical protein